MVEPESQDSRGSSKIKPSHPAVKILDSKDLFERGQTELRLKHGDEEYRLRVTRQGKLLLTK